MNGIFFSAFYFISDKCTHVTNLQSKVQAILNTAYRPNMQASYMMGSRTTQEN